MADVRERPYAMRFIAPVPIESIIATRQGLARYS